ncbi:hypothetical protein NPIL_195881 [Nephila pilipes]|uniref:Uncharacterized protein n=1 Tax=Nephila pilipes TaxID=299642 RepID=A0A8X6NHX0_NEPPI|nr:hypothetical protein NPIL_195881 [Nephila pilipes]
MTYRTGNVFGRCLFPAEDLSGFHKLLLAFLEKDKTLTGSKENGLQRPCTRMSKTMDSIVHLAQMNRKISPRILGKE